MANLLTLTTVVLIDRAKFIIGYFRYINYYEQYCEYDPFFTPTELANPWLTDNPEFWDEEKQAWVTLMSDFVFILLILPNLPQK